MRNDKLIRVLSNGGVLTPKYLKNILKVARSAGNDVVHFGSRQDVLFEVSEGAEQEVSGALVGLGIDAVWKGEEGVMAQNIVSSLVTRGVLPSVNWLNEGVYMNILDAFDFQPKIEVNILDAQQNLIPLFNGFVNFIASDNEGFWYLYINNKKGDLFQWPSLIDTEEIVPVTRFIEIGHTKGEDVCSKGFIRMLNDELRLPYYEISESNKLQLPSGFFPSYEGIIPMEIGKNFWAGFYWRNNAYDIGFMEEVCDLCLEQGVSKINLTPWKTFLVKDIKKDDRIFWEQLLGRFGINMRHSSLELNWYLPLRNMQAFKLKQFLVSEFDKVDVRTFGLTFSIVDQLYDGLQTSVKIIKERKPGFLGLFNPSGLYKIYVAKNFNVNQLKYKLHAENVSKEDLSQEMISLSKLYYQGLPVKGFGKPKVKTVNNKKAEDALLVYRCSNCLSVYDEQFGDLLQGIGPGVTFDKLPEEYVCGVCQSRKAAFEKVSVMAKFLHKA